MMLIATGSSGLERRVDGADVPKSPRRQVGVRYISYFMAIVEHLRWGGASGLA
jgi:hypothetical protein